MICFFGCKAFRSTNMLFYLFVTFLVDVCRLPGPYILTGSHTNPGEFIAQSKFREAEWQSGWDEMSQTTWQEHVNAFISKICCNIDIYDMIWHHVLGAESFFTHQNRRELCEFCACSTLDLLYPMWNDWDCLLPGCTNSRTSMPSKHRCGAFWVELWVCVGKSSMYHVWFKWI